MRNEVDAAANFIAANLNLGTNGSSSFVALLSTTLTKRYSGHWHAGEPERGSAFRALTRSGHAVDQLILDAAASAATLDASQVCRLLSKNMQSDRWTLWIDPGCVSIRLHEGGATTFTTLDQASKSSAALAGIREIWGKLPASLVGASPSAAATVASSVERPKTPFNRKSSTDEVHAAAMSEFAELIKEANASPSKRSKAIAIVRPGSVSAAMAAAAADPVRQAATPPRPPLPPLHFTIQESTSPYVPSFAVPSAAGAHIASSATPSNSTTPTPLAPSPLAAVSTTGVTSSHSECASDPFARPSSRSSTTSAESAISCSIFSHSSSESRSSSIGSYSTMASSVMPSIASVIPKATQHEMYQAAMFTFPNALSSMSGVKSMPASPSKPRRSGPRHQHTLSTSSAVSTGSVSSAASGAPGSHPGHQRARSSQSNIRISANAGQVQDYSNGKVGVLGGGVLLGLGGGNKSSSSSDKNARRPGPRPTSASSSSSSNGGGERQRSKSRTPSASGSISGSAGYPMWYNQHQYHPVPPMNQHWMQGQA